MFTTTDYLSDASFKSLQCDFNIMFNRVVVSKIQISLKTGLNSMLYLSFYIVQEGKRLATKPTLFYLMHCGKALYNNLLWKNWSTQHLPLMIIIGNSFNGMKDRFVPNMYDGSNV